MGKMRFLLFIILLLMANSIIAIILMEVIQVLAWVTALLLSLDAYSEAKKQYVGREKDKII